MADQTASTSSNELKQKLAHHIEAARGKLDALKRDITNLHDADMQRLRQKRDEIHRRLDEQKDKARKLQAEIVSWRKEKIAHTQDTIASWRQRRELDKLRARADRAEQHALDLVTVAAIDFEEAEQAVLDAVAARFDADAAASTGTEPRP